MNKVPLRVYNQDIEEAIENRQIEEAIAHCHHILKIFPKHIDTYRLLGKAYLESQRYGNAADIFQRVLSSIPNDFISHIGMSIISEDEGNLDAAIYHMERAFETQPYNTAIQGELRRLYGRRDGMEPPKIRLTRGALARMYAKGELYKQAIAEIRTNLAQDPKRPDLQVLLAEMYSSNGQEAEAIEVCSTLLKQLPYCLKANQLLAELIPEGERENETSTCRHRLQSLDPYFAYIGPQAPTIEDVPDQAVTVTRLDWDGIPITTEAAGQPEWATSIGVDLKMEDEEDEELPEWLVESDEDQKDFEVEPTSETSQAEKDIPDWITEAGFEPSNGIVDESAISIDTDEESIDGDDAISAEIPSWLEGIAPEGVFEGDQDEKDSIQQLKMEEDLPDWLSEEADGSSDTIITWLDSKQKDDDESLEPEHDVDEELGVPDWLTDLEVTETEDEVEVPSADRGTVEESQSAEDEIPAWLQDLTEDQTEIAAEEEPKIEIDDHASALQTDIPDWLRDFEEDASEAEVEFELGEDSAGEEPTIPAEYPDWLQELGEPEAEAEAEPKAEVTEADETQVELEAEPTADVREDEEAVEAEIPDWLEDLGEAGLEAEIESEPAAEVTEDVELQAELEAELPADVTEEEAVEAEIPDWLQELGEAEAEVDVETTAEVTKEEEVQAELEAEPTADVTEEEAVEAEIPDWLQELGEAEAEVEAEPTGEVTEEEAVEAEIPDWLQELGEAEVEVETAAEVTEEVEAVDEAEPSADVTEEEAIEAEIPDWLQELGEAEMEAEIESGPAAEVPKEVEAVDEAELVAEVTEEEPAVPAEIPDWLQELGEAEPDAEVAADVIEDAEVQAELEAEPTAEVTEEEAVEAEIPDWLQELGEAEAEVESEPTAEVTKEEEVQAELEAEPTAEVTEEEAVEAEIPDWLQELGEPGAEAEAEPKAEVTEADETQVELEAKPTVEVTEEEPAVPAEIPDWLQEIGEAEPDAEVAADEIEEAEVQTELEAEPTAEITEEEAIEAEIPDWLQEPGEAEAEVEVEPSAEVTEEEAVEAEIPDWLQEFEEAEPEAEIEAEPTADVTEEVEALDEAEPVVEVTEEEPAVPAEIPDWLQELGEAELEAEIEAEPAVEVTEDSEVQAELEAEPSAEVTKEAEAVEEAEPSAEVTEEEPAVPVEIPEWLQDFAEDQPAEQDGGEPVERELTSEVQGEPVEEPIKKEADIEEPEIPEWLQDFADDQPEAEIRSEIPADGADEETPSPEAEIPEWLEELREMEPDEEIEETPISGISEEEAAVSDGEIPAWLLDYAEQLPESDTEAQEVAERTQEDDGLEAEAGDTGEVEADVPSAHELGTKPLPGLADVSQAPLTEEKPEWLHGLGEEEPEAESIPEAEEKAQFGEIEEPAEETLDIEDAEVSEWLERPITDEEDRTYPTGVTTWLGDLDEEELAKKKIDYEPGELPSWLEELDKHKPEPETGEESIADTAPTIPVSQEEDEPEFADAEDAMAWLESLAAKQGISEDELITEPEEQDAAQAYEKEIIQEHEPKPTEEEDAIDEIDATASPVEEAEPVEGEETAKIEDAEALFGEKPASVTPDIEVDADAAIAWLESIAESESSEDTSTEEAALEITSLQEEEGDLPSESEVDAEETAGIEAEADFSDADSAMAWLEGLAAKQGVTEEELITRPEDRTEKPPEWVQDEIQAMEQEEQPDRDGDTFDEEGEIVSEYVKPEDAVKDLEKDLQQEDFFEDDDEVSKTEAAEPTSAEADEPAEETQEPAEIKVEDTFDYLDEDINGDDHPRTLETIPDVIELPAGESEVDTEEADVPEWLRETIEAETAEMDEDSKAAETDLVETPIPLETAIEPEGEIEAVPKEDEDETADTEDDVAVIDEDYQWLPTDDQDTPVLIDLNQASLIELERLESLGFRTAQAIVAYREEHGPFTDLDDLQTVIDIDEMTLAMLKTEVEIQTLPTEMDPGIDDQKEPSSVEPKDESHAILLDAQAEASVGKLDSALKKYESLAEKGERLDEVIADLNQILSGDVSNEACVDIYQLLGDAYLNADDLQKALEAYTKAEELLR